MPKTLTPKRPVHAVRWMGTAESFSEVQDFVGDVLRGERNQHDNSILLRTYSGGNDRVYVGDWIVKWLDDTFDVVHDHTVTQYYVIS